MLAESLLTPRAVGQDGTLDSCVLLGAPTAPVSSFWIGPAQTDADIAAYHSLRYQVFVTEQRLFKTDDRDDRDADPRTEVLLARAADGTLLGGVRLGPAGDGPDLGWWQGGRLVVAAAARHVDGVGRALVRAACATAEARGALRFDATVQQSNERFFTHLGWTRIGSVTVAGQPHVLMRWPIDRIERLALGCKGLLGDLLTGLVDSGAGFTGDDAAPVPGSDLVAACDAIVPTMVERDPEWAGWCSVLVNLNDLYSMGATPVGLLDSVAGPDREAVARVLTGVRRAAEAWGVPVIGGHTQLGVRPALSVTALGRSTTPVAAGGAEVGDQLRLTADLGGGWRAGHTGVQWDSSTHRTASQLGQLAGVVPALAPKAAKDISMAGLVGTTGMLAEASDCSAVLDVAAIVRPDGVAVGDWLTCFPGFAMITAEPADRPQPTLPDFLTSARCGRLEPGAGVRLHWPDGQTTVAVAGPVTGLGAA